MATTRRHYYRHGLVTGVSKRRIYNLTIRPFRVCRVKFTYLWLHNFANYLHESRRVARTTPVAPSAHEASIITGRIHELEQPSQDLTVLPLASSAHQERLREQLVLAQALLAPRRRVPPELWSEIFSYPPSEDWISCPVDKRHLPLAEVCRIWREPALHIPHLGSSIVVEVWDDYEERPPLRLGLSKAVSDEGKNVPPSYPSSRSYLRMAQI
ncbi:hypothetical protein GGF50DRAFT_112696 [Schizophyllum commune]